MARRAAASGGPEGVERFLASLEHPCRREIAALREIILGAAPGVTEEIKWNAPSFRTTAHFATFHLRATDGVQVILHAGAKRRDGGPARGARRSPTFSATGSRRCDDDAG